MLTNRTLAKINNRPREVGRVPLLVLGGGTLAMAALLYIYEILPSFAILAVLGGGVLLTLVLYISQKAKMTIRLSYKGNLDEETASRFASVREALEGLASSGRIWRLPDSAKLPKAAEVASSPAREPARAGLLPTPGIKADVPVWGIEAGEENIFFFPEGALIYVDDRYDPLPYKSLKVAFSSARFFEEEELPDDATVVDHTWRFSRPDGSPDPRYKRDNAQIPIVLYGLLKISTPSLPMLRLEVSDRLAAARFAKMFGAKISVEEPIDEKAAREEHRRAEKDYGRSSSTEGEEGRRSAATLEREARLARARRTLGVAKGAGAEEVGAAYRKLARTHHPDKVANLEPEIREYSEQRMKEINSAYAEFKRLWNDPAAEGARVG